ncbi:cysteine hydrolase family protein [Conexibacter arvalis]|uniref:Nicotinamidase-related amidase n=1 Tax=Conexibacter arvalis TaxID=912552 RepID=A0A840IBN1_9ACTN|nr:isochorismatase family cysteine hydrolase [Conexibacter arvalis]MBB4662299.1 nicotinamidase-related amidase [Conexibacter arvalis]
MTASSVLIVCDMLNPYDHDDADALAASAEAVVEPLRDLIERSRDADGVDVVWVNDNHGDYAAQREQLVERALAGRRPDLIEPLVPAPDHEFLVKVRHSAFYGTALDELLRTREARRVILTGQVTEQCVLYTALDAYVRHFEIRVVRDAVAHIDRSLSDAALRMMERNMRAEIVAAADCLGARSGA